MAIHYLNGLGRTRKNRVKTAAAKLKAQVTASKNKFTAAVQPLTSKVKEANKRIIAKQKVLAKKIGAGVKRIAQIPRSVAEKKLLFALEKNLFQMSSRIKAEYTKNPAETKQFLSSLGSYANIAAAINIGSPAGVRLAGAKPDYQGQCKCGNQNVWAKECCLRGVGEDTTGSGTGGNEAAQYAEYTKQGVGLITRIMEWFKKRKAEKKGDKEAVETMADSVDADAGIPKVDENGNALPDDPEAVDSGSGSGKPAEENNTMLIVGVVGAAAVAGYFLMKKR
jgi:hypothetical protein